MEIYGPIKFTATLVDGSGDEFLTRDSTTKSVGTVSDGLGSLQDGRIWVGDGDDAPQAVTVSGDITISNAGVAAISAGVIVNADIHASAAIALSKLASLTASRALVSDGTGVISTANTTATEIGYVSGVTSPIQTQLDDKQATITGGATTITSNNLTANRALQSSSTGKVEVSSVTNTELGYLSGADSNIQDQLDAKFEAVITSPAEGDILYFDGSDWVNLSRGEEGEVLVSTATSVEWGSAVANGLPAGGTDGQALLKQSSTDYDSDWETLTVAHISDLTASAAELNILDGAIITTAELNFLDNASANIQTQLNGKLSTSLATGSILKGVAGVATASTDLPTGVTIGGAVIYRVGGNDVTLADGGTGSSLSDPGADRILFWDDSAGQVTWLSLGTGLGITGTTLNGSNLFGTGATNRVAFFSSTNVLTSDENFVYDPVGRSLKVREINWAETEQAVVRNSLGNMSISGAGVFIRSTAGVIEIDSDANDIVLEGAGIRIETTLSEDNTADVLAVDSDGYIVTKEISTGSYTPTATPVLNVENVTEYELNYIRVGDMVTVFGRVDVETTEAGEFRFTLTVPFANGQFDAVTNPSAAGGVAHQAGLSNSFAIRPDHGTQTVRCSGHLPSAGNFTEFFFTFSYKIP